MARLGPILDLKNHIRCELWKPYGWTILLTLWSNHIRVDLENHMVFKYKTYMGFKVKHMIQPYGFQCQPHGSTIWFTMSKNIWISRPNIWFNLWFSRPNHIWFSRSTMGPSRVISLPFNWHRSSCTGLMRPRLEFDHPLPFILPSWHGQV